MWIADALTLSRIPLALGFWWACAGDHAAWSVATLALAALTDAVDGTVARWSKRRRGIPLTAPARGDWLDPIADKLFVAIVVAALLVHADPAPPATLVVLIVARELVLAPLAIFAAIGIIRRPPRGELRAATIGKVATIVQFFALAALVVAPDGWLAAALAIVAAVTGIAAVVRYAAARA